MKYIVFLWLLLFAGCWHNSNEGPFSVWVEQLLTDSIHMESGSLLAEPYAKRTNHLPDIIYLSPNPFFSGTRNNLVNQVFSIHDSLTAITLPTEELNQLIQANKITRDTAIFSNRNLNPLGRIYINQVLINTEHNAVYIDHAYSGPRGKSVFSALTELRLKDGKWFVTRTEVYEMSN